MAIENFTLGMGSDMFNPVLGMDLDTQDIAMSVHWEVHERLFYFTCSISFLLVVLSKQVVLGCVSNSQKPINESSPRFCKT